MNYIEIEAENKTGNILKLIFENINIEKYFYYIKDEEIHRDTPQNRYVNCFEKIISGKELKEFIDNNLEYYMIFLTMFVFVNKEEAVGISDLESFKKSKSNLAFICWDVTNIIICFKEESFFNGVRNNLLKNKIKFKDLKEEDVKSLKF